MRAVIQRVRRASLFIADEKIDAISAGMLAMIGIQRGDTPATVQRMAERLLRWRMFADQQGRTNNSLLDIGGELMLVPNFTVAADTRKGSRASFSSAADPDAAAILFASLIEAVKGKPRKLVCGRFGADMQIELLNEGPVTFILEAG